MNFVYVIVIVGEMVEEVMRYNKVDIKNAEDCFVGFMERKISNFEDYTSDDIDACIEDGYEGFGQGNSIQLHWSDT